MKWRIVIGQGGWQWGIHRELANLLSIAGAGNWDLITDHSPLTLALAAADMGPCPVASPTV